MKAVGNTKTCSACRESLSLDSFHRNRAMPDGLHSNCKRCVSSANTSWRLRNPDKKRAQHRKTKYGLTESAFKALSEQQGTECAICHKSRPLVVDHNHKTGDVRGLLCNNCNRAIGLFGDDFATLISAARYLNRTAR